MLSDKFNPPLCLKLSSSGLLFYFIIASHLLALSLLTLALNIDSEILIFIGLVILVSLFFSLKNNNSVNFFNFICVLQCHNNERWTITNSKGIATTTRLRVNYRIFPSLIILYFELQDHSNKVLIVIPDMLSGKDFRLLRVHLNQY